MRYCEMILADKNKMKISTSTITFGNSVNATQTRKMPVKFYRDMMEGALMSLLIVSGSTVCG
jgi:hypothetical protein